MAIKIKPKKTIPLVDLDYLQFNQFHMAISELPPNNISVTAKLRHYGIADNVRYYDRNEQDMSIANLDAYIATKVPTERQLEAVQALVKVQEGLAVLASIYSDVEIVGVE